MKATSTIHRQTHANTHVMVWLRRYCIAVGLIALGCARWKYHLLIHAHEHFGGNSFQMWVAVLDSGSYLLAIVLMLTPWWRLGDVISALGYVIALPGCVYFLVGFSAVDLLYIHQQTWLHCFMLSGALGQVLWLFLRLRAEGRQAAIVHSWKEGLRRNHRDKSAAVEQFILEIEGDARDVARWNKFAEANTKDNPMAMWKRLDLEWAKWLRLKRATVE